MVIFVWDFLMKVELPSGWCSVRQSDIVDAHSYGTVT